MHSHLKFLVVQWLGVSITVRVRVRARDGKWIFFVPFFFFLLKVTNTFVLLD